MVAPNICEDALPLTTRSSDRLLYKRHSRVTPSGFVSRTRPILERPTGFEPVPRAWKALMQPSTPETLVPHLSGKPGQRSGRAPELRRERGCLFSVGAAEGTRTLDLLNGNQTL